MSRRDGLPGILVLGCRMQRPDRWWDVLGWWDELGQPVRRLARRLGLDWCRCSVIGHRWHRSSAPFLVALCHRSCCRGVARGEFWQERHPGRPDVSDVLTPPGGFR